LLSDTPSLPFWYGNAFFLVWSAGLSRCVLTVSFSPFAIAPLFQSILPAQSPSLWEIFPSRFWVQRSGFFNPPPPPPPPGAPLLESRFFYSTRRFEICFFLLECGFMWAGRGVRFFPVFSPEPPLSSTRLFKMEASRFRGTTQNPFGLPPMLFHCCYRPRIPLTFL